MLDFNKLLLFPNFVLQIFCRFLIAISVTRMLLKFNSIVINFCLKKMPKAAKTSRHSKYFGPATRLQSKCSNVDEKSSALVTSKTVKIENENISLAGNVSKQMEKKISIENVAKPKRPKLEVQWEPKNWKEQFEHIRLMRKAKDAPVDTMGCERCTKDGYTEKEKRFHLLVSLMLSSQTKDEVTHAAMNRLLNHGLTVDKLLHLSDKDLGELIYPVGFWRKKVNYLKRTASVLRSDYDDDIPNSVKDLVKLPGVGPKMAYLAMNCAWNQVVGIGVDVHVHRISNRLGWVRKKTKEPEQTRKELESWLPQDMWKETNWLLVGFGQQICLPVSPKCSSCLNRNICPASTAKK